jgi:hypothetical protein
MDVRINEVQSRVHTMDSQTLMEPRMLHQIVRACLEALKDQEMREKRLEEERRLVPGVSADEI